MRRWLAVAVMVTLCLPVASAYAQDDDDGWNDVQYLMGGLTAANQRLLGAGLDWGQMATGGDPAQQQYVQALMQFARSSAQLLGSVDGAFGLNDDAERGQYWDPFAPGAPNPLVQQSRQLQQMGQQPATPTMPVMPALPNGILFPRNP